MSTIRYELRLEDHAAFAERMNVLAVSQGLQRFASGRTLTVVMLMFVLVEVLGAVGFFLNGRPVAGAMLTAVAGYTAFIWLRWRRRTSAGQLASRLNEIMKRQIDAGEIRVPLGPQSITLTESGFEFVREGVEARYSWQAIDHVESLPRHILIFDQSHSAVIVPKRAFANESAMQEFEGIVETHLRDSRERHPPILRGATREFVRLLDTSPGGAA